MLFNSCADQVVIFFKFQSHSCALFVLRLHQLGSRKSDICLLKSSNCIYLKMGTYSVKIINIITSGTLSWPLNYSSGNEVSK